LKNIFKVNRFYPQNFFIEIDEKTDINTILMQISYKASTISPDSFDAEVNYFIFKFNYYPPYVKASEFPEMRNLQIEAITNTRFKDEYNGYIGIDISEWIDHMDEEHFQNCLLFLKSMTEHWKYIFFTQQKLCKNSIEKPITEIQKYIFLHELSCSDFRIIDFKDFFAEIIENMYGISITPAGQGVLSNIFNNRNFVNSSMIIDIAKDINMYFCGAKNISKEDIIMYLYDTTTYAHFIMTEEETCTLKKIENKEKNS
jgi:hypothetical protein